MLLLEIPILLIASLGALYGIWTKPQLDKTVAVVSTLFTVAGMLAAMSLAIWKTSDAREKAQLAEQTRRAQLLAAEQARRAQLQATLMAAELSDLKISWTFAGAPKAALDMYTLGELVSDSRLLSDDEVSRLPNEVLDQIKNAWRLSDTVGPLLVAAERGDIELTKFYKGEDPGTAIQRWKTRDAKESQWKDGIGSAISFEGPVYTLLFPLSHNSSALLALGNREDDVVSEKPTLVWHQDYPSLFSDSNFGFNVQAELVKDGFQLVWNYDQASLMRAAVRPVGAKISAKFPEQFSFFLVHRSLKKSEYLNKRPKPSDSSLAKNSSANSNWNEKSTLEIYVNGLKEPHYTFDAKRVGTFPHKPHLGAYDAPEVEFEYTEFVATLRSLE